MKLQYLLLFCETSISQIKKLKFIKERGGRRTKTRGISRVGVKVKDFLHFSGNLPD